MDTWSKVLPEAATVLRGYDKGRPRLVAAYHPERQLIGVLTREQAWAYGALGPTARASGVDIDVRRDHPQSAYGLVEWDVVVRERGDVFRAGVGLHPSFCTTDEPDSPHLAVAPYTGSLYIGFGSEDQMQPAPANGPLIEDTNALDKGEAEIHDGADHGFGVYGGSYHEGAADRSYERTKVMFDRELMG